MQFIIHVSVVVVGEHGILFVQEGKPENRGKWNLPGGHVHYGEHLLAGAQREVLEETGIRVDIETFLGVYTGLGRDHYLRFTFVAGTRGTPAPQDDSILQCRFFRGAEFHALAPESLVAPQTLELIMQDFESGRRLPLDGIREFHP